MICENHCFTHSTAGRFGYINEIADSFDAAVDPGLAGSFLGKVNT